ncbi:MAG: endonuclease/exonuclease/phosphatase family protein [Saprospiraceae bacterium]|nr:endonuclease/exonuclease/phosphatase family protein [Saprospiraceae bacterium]
MLRFFLSLNIVWFIVCIGIYLMVGLEPSIFWMFSIVSLFIPVVFLINIILILFWLLFNWKNAWLPLVTIVLGWNPLLLMFSFGETSDANKCRKDPISIMSYNVYGLKQLKDTSAAMMQMKKNKFISFIRQHDPDILCVQEDNFFADEIINNAGIYPHFHYLIQHGAAIYSKFPILDKGRIDFGKRTNSCLWVDVLMQGKTVRVYSLHLQSNQITKEVTAITTDQSEENDKTVGTIRRMLRKYKNSAIIRSKQALLVKQNAIDCGKPCIIAGDFNDTPFSHCYKVLAQDRNDSFLECGSGLGTTYAGALPGLRIDYVMGDLKEIIFCSHRVLHTPYSDHHPVFAKFYVK